jgi:phage shock protein PspC (stress-responsive transcriptional regulator)
MKKVLNINFQGRIIPIEESAFEQVQNYIQSLRAYFQNEEGRDEIINDIEDRIAELFEKEIKKGALCITDLIASSVIAGMGKVEDFEKLEGEPQERAEASSSNPSANAPKGSLMRNSNDKILGGVCSGIAHTLRIDPTVIRVLFALLSVGGGTGILIYLILWIVLPEQPLTALTQKRLFRNPDQKVIAGICGGIASYFNIPVWIPRIIFLIPVIAGIFSSAFSHLFILTGGFGGTLFLTYIILWIVLPVAKTPTEKMQMRGDKIDVSSIKSAVQDEMQGVKGRLENVGKQLKSGAEKMSKEASETAGMLSQKISRGAGTTGNRVVHMIGIFFKVVFWIFIGSIAFALMMAFSGLTVGSVVMSPMSDVVFSENAQEWAFWGTILFFFLIINE